MNARRLAVFLERIDYQGDCWIWTGLVNTTSPYGRFYDGEHGTTSRYTAYKCRCDLCRAGWSAYWKAYRLRKKLEAAS